MTGQHVPVEAGSTATFQDVRWQQLADELPFETLTRIRAIGAKWAATIGSITGVFAIVALIKGPEDIGALGSPERYWVIGLTAVAVVSATAAMLWAAHAAQGSAVEQMITGPVLRSVSQAEARSGALAIKASRWLVAAAVGSLALAIGITWLSTPQTTSSGSVIAASPGGTPICGAVTGLTQDGVVVQPKGLASQVIPVEAGVVILPIASCPG